MAGGFGNRLWPLTRESRPKQFLPLGESGATMLGSTYGRCLKLVPPENILVVSLERFAPQVRRLLPGLPEENIILEPHSRKTAPCVVLSTYEILRRNPDATIAMMPSDHVILDEDSCVEALREAMEYAASDEILVALGTAPSSPNPNYGYIQFNSGATSANGHKVAKVKTFTEKPDPDIAEIFWKSGEFYWNCGTFVWQAKVIKEECERYIPEITRLFEGWENILGTAGQKAWLEKVYSVLPKLSIDYGVMEKTLRAWVYPSDFRWLDIDGWETICSLFGTEDKDGNVSNCSKTYLEETRDSILLTGKGGKMIAAKGLHKYLVVDSEDVLLICPRDDEKYRAFVTGTAMPGYEEFR